MTAVASHPLLAARALARAIAQEREEGALLRRAVAALVDNGYSLAGIVRGTAPSYQLAVCQGKPEAAARLKACLESALFPPSPPADTAQLVFPVPGLGALLLERPAQADDPLERELLQESADNLGSALAGLECKSDDWTYRSLFGHMLNGVAHCRIVLEEGRPVDWVYLDVNQAFIDQTGLKDVVGRPVSQAIPGIHQSDPELLAIYSRVARTGQPERFERFVEALQAWFSVSAYCTQPDTSWPSSRR